MNAVRQAWMANRVLASVALIFVAVVCIPASARGEKEFRAFWADAWGKGFKTPEQTTALVDFAARYGFNNVIVQVRKRGDACYDSTLEPRDSALSEGYDPLADILEKAHRRGIKVHAWVMLYDAWVESRFVKLQPNHVMSLHPDWICLNDKGEKTYVQGRIYLDPGLPEVREYLTRVVLDIVRRYPVDGIHLDGLRYCDSSFGYNPRSIALFNAAFKREGMPKPQDPDFCQWRREQCTMLARELCAEIRKTRPSAQISLSAYYSQSDIRDRFFQDWPSWAKTDWFDFIVPMVFVPKTVAEFAETVEAELACGNGKNIYIGQGAWRFPSATTNRHLRVIRGKGAPGFVLFDYTALSVLGKDGKCLADKLAIVR